MMLNGPFGGIQLASFAPQGSRLLGRNTTLFLLLLGTLLLFNNVQQSTHTIDDNLSAGTVKAVQ